MISENEKSRGVGSTVGFKKQQFLSNNPSTKEERQAFFRISETYSLTSNELVENIINLSIKETLLYLFILRKTKGYHTIKRVISSKEIKKSTGLSNEEMMLVRESLKRKKLIDYEVFPFNGERCSTVYHVSGGESTCHI